MELKMVKALKGEKCVNSEKIWCKIRKRLGGVEQNGVRKVKGRLK